MMDRRLRATLATMVAVAMASAFAWAAVIGRAKTPLDGRPVRKAECTLGDLLADAARAAIKVDAQGAPVKAEVALIQAGQLREEVIPAGDLTEEQLRSLLLFPDEQVALVEITGDTLQVALERGLSALPQPSIGFLQVSGVQVRFRSQSPRNERIESVTVGGKPLDAKQTYLVAVPASLAKGAGGYFRILDARQVKGTGPQLQQALCDYVRASGAINLSAGERLKDLSPPPAGK